MSVAVAVKTVTERKVAAGRIARKREAVRRSWVDLAQQAVVSMQEACSRDPLLAAEVGLHYADRLLHSNARADVKATLKVTLQCVALLGQSIVGTPVGGQDEKSAVVASVVALRACFHGIRVGRSAPVGSLLAGVGTLCMTAEDLGPFLSVQHAVLMGRTYCQALVDAVGTHATEKQVAGWTLDIADRIVGHASNPKASHTVGKLFRSCLSTLAPCQVRRQRAKVLAEVGAKAMYAPDIVITATEAALIGLGFTHAIQDVTKGAEQAAARAALQAYEQDAASKPEATAHTGARILGTFLKQVSA